MTAMLLEHRNAVDAIVRQCQAESMNQGVAINLHSPEFGDYAWAYGDGNRRPQVPLGINDHMRIGSTSKSLLGQLMLREIDQGTPIPGVTPSQPVTLDTKLFHFVSGVPRGDVITIRDLMTMRSGVYDYHAADVFPHGALDAGGAAGVRLRAGVIQVGRLAGP